jgi:hypothetical protein
VLIHHPPGWDEYYREFSRRFAEHGFIAVCPDLYERYGHGTPDDVAALVRGDGSIADASLIADAEAAMGWTRPTRPATARSASSAHAGAAGTRCCWTSSIPASAPAHASPSSWTSPPAKR